MGTARFPGGGGPLARASARLTRADLTGGSFKRSPGFRRIILFDDLRGSEQPQNPVEERSENDHVEKVDLQVRNRPSFGYQFEDHFADELGQYEKVHQESGGLMAANAIMNHQDIQKGLQGNRQEQRPKESPRTAHFAPHSHRL